MSPAFELADGVTYEEAVAGLVEVTRKSREEARDGKPASPRSPLDIARGDQTQGASEDNMETMGRVLGQPDIEGEMSDDVLARVTLAWLACHPCPHIKENAAQPHVALLAVHRLACERCVKTVVKPPPENEDRCDWCWSHGHTQFQPIRMSYGPATLMGDACDACNAKLTCVDN